MFKLTTLAIVASIACSSVFAQQEDIVFDPSTMSDSQMLKFGNQMARTSWKAFTSGFYSKTGRTFEVTDECFGDWVVTAFHDIDDLLSNFLDLEFENLSLDSVLTAAQGIYDLAYRNSEACGFHRFAEEAGSFFVENCTAD